MYGVGTGLRARRKALQGLHEYFLAGRTIKGWQAGTSMAATQFAADTPLLVTGLVATAGVFALWRLWIYGLAFLVFAFLFAVWWRRAGVLTDAELTCVRYSGRGVMPLRLLKAIYYGTVIQLRGAGDGWRRSALPRCSCPGTTGCRRLSLLRDPGRHSDRAVAGASSR